MIILSFDIGIKNLAYSIIEYTDNKWYLLDWYIINCESNNVVLKLIEELDSLPQFLDVDVVLLEKQPAFNPKMRIISNAIYVYFNLRCLHELNKKVKIIFYSAKHKLNCCSIQLENKTKSKYTNNKKLAIEHTKYILKDDEKWLNFFSNNKKKDDLADCFLQALSYFKFSI